MRPVFFLLSSLFLLNACQQQDPPKPEQAARVYFETPAAADTVATTFDVHMVVEGLELAKAGTMTPGTGHLHVLIDEPFIQAGLLIPNDENHRHFGDASVHTQLTLAPGPHTLRLQFADGAHIALLGDQYRSEIMIYVQ